MSLTAFFSGILLIAALTADSFVVSFSYGAQKVSLPWKLVLFMNLVMSSLLAGGIWAGRLLEHFFPETLALTAGALVLLGMGGYRLLRFFLGERGGESRGARQLDYFQGLFLALILSLDGLAAGVGTGLAKAPAAFLILGAFFGGSLIMEIGWRAGRHFQKLFQKDISWISGLCLLLLGVKTLCKL